VAKEGKEISESFRFLGEWQKHVSQKMALASVPTLLMIITNHVRTKSCLCGFTIVKMFIILKVIAIELYRIYEEFQRMRCF